MTHTLIPGEPHGSSEEETMSMIRAVLTEDTQPAPSEQARLHVVSTNPAPQKEQQPEISPREVARRNRAAFAELESAEPQRPPRPASWISVRLSRAHSVLSARLRGFRPTTRQLAIASVLLLMVVRPIWFAIGLFLMLALVIVTFVSVGEDRIWTAVLNHLKSIETKDPERAATYRSKLDHFAYRWDSVLDRLPDAIVGNLYMPDFQSLAEAEDRHTDVMTERLRRMGDDG